MLLYRVFPYLSGAAPGKPGHPLYVHPAQGLGRFDNPHHYLAWYVTSEAVSAVGESFAHLSTWRDEMFAFPHIPGARRALGVYDVADDLPYVDLDDPRRLLDLGVRPSQVVERNRPYTQALALRIHEQGSVNGIRWGSFHRPQWRVWCLWEIDATVADVEVLTVDSAAVKSAAVTLVRPIV